MIVVEKRSPRGGPVLVGEYESHFSNGEAWYGNLSSALETAREIHAVSKLTVVVSVIVDGVRLTDEEIAAYAYDARTVEELVARDEWVKAFFDDIQTRTPAALAAARDREHQAMIGGPLEFGL